MPPGEGDPLVEGMRRLYAHVLGAARARRQEGQALLAMGHLYLVGTQLSELSERKVLGGNQHALPHELFPPDVAYAALGHLHKAQAVGGREGVRYSGSPLPLSLDEEPYQHQVCLVELEGPALVRVRALPVPRLVPILRVPERGSGTLAQVLEELAALPRHEGPLPPPALRPLLGIHVRLEGPEPALRQRLEEALAGKLPRLVRVTAEAGGRGGALADTAPPSLDLRSLLPEQVFVRRYQSRHGAASAPSAELLAAFHELRDALEQAEGGTP